MEKFTIFAGTYYITPKGGYIAPNFAIFYYSCFLAPKLRMKKEYLKNLSDLISKRMGEGKYTMIRFADEAGVSVRTMNNIMNKKTSITFEVVEKICDAHGFSLVDVFGLQEELDKKTLDKTISTFVLTDGKNNYKISPNLINHR